MIPILGGGTVFLVVIVPAWLFRKAPLSRVWNRRPERFLRRRGRPPRGLVDRHVAKERRKSRAISLEVSVSHENRSPTAVGAERQC